MLLQAGTSYYIVVDGYAGAGGQYVLSMDCPRCQEEAHNAQILQTVKTGRDADGERGPAL